MPPPPNPKFTRQGELEEEAETSTSLLNLKTIFALLPARSRPPFYVAACRSIIYRPPLPLLRHKTFSTSGQESGVPTINGGDTTEFAATMTLPRRRS